MRNYAILVAGLAVAACSGAESTADEATAGEAAIESTDAADTAEMAEGNEYNPEDGRDIGLPMGVRLMPEAELVEQTSEGNATIIRFTSRAAAMQVVDWYYRKFEAADLEPRPSPTAADGSLGLSVDNAQGNIMLTVQPADSSGVVNAELVVESAS